MDPLDHEMTGRRQSDDIIIRLEGQFDNLSKKLDKIVGWFEGDGTVGNPGVMIRLDRLEQAELTRNQHRIILYTAIVGLIVERAYHYFLFFKGAGGHGG